jgi:hypothetical protein
MMCYKLRFAIFYGVMWDCGLPHFMGHRDLGFWEGGIHTVKGRGQCEYLSPQEVTKTISMDAVINQLTDGRREGECVGVESKSFDV